MTFSSLTDLMSEINAGKTSSFIFQKQSPSTAALTAGRWYDLSRSAGNPRNNAFSGTALAWTTCNEATGNGTEIFGIPHGGNVSPDGKVITKVSAFSSIATSAPSTLMLVDLQGYWPGISTASATTQTLTGTPSLRYTNGEGCRLYFVQTVAAGATAHSISISYTNSAGTPASGKTMPSTIAMTASAIVGHISHSGSAVNNTAGPFLPLANGDTGVSNVASVTFSASSLAGTGALCLARPLLTIPLILGGVASERDLLNQLPSLPTVKDGACLVWLLYAGAATVASTAYFGQLDFAWG